LAIWASSGRKKSRPLVDGLADTATAFFPLALILAAAAMRSS